MVTIINKFRSLSTLSILSLTLSNCETISPIDSTVIKSGLEATLPFKVEGISYKGVATVPRKSNQKFEFDFNSDIAWALFSTCHRDFKIKNPKGYWKWYYVPAMFIENVGSCILIHKQITTKGTEHFAIVNFSAGESLKATMACNGSKTEEVGASICQAREGTIQRLWFHKPVKAYTDDSCPPISENGYRMEYKIKSDFCAYLFIDADGEIHRHVSYGYTQSDLWE